MKSGILLVSASSLFSPSFNFVLYGQSLVKDKNIKCPMCRHDTRLSEKNLDVALRTNGDILQMKDILEKERFSSNK
jgi:hypothetical protein